MSPDGLSAGAPQNRFTPGTVAIAGAVGVCAAFLVYWYAAGADPIRPPNIGLIAWVCSSAVAAVAATGILGRVRWAGARVAAWALAISHTVLAAHAIGVAFWFRFAEPDPLRYEPNVTWLVLPLHASIFTAVVTFIVVLVSVIVRRWSARARQ